MASKFQNRLVGTIVIVALGVIILPGLLDGKKKHYKDDFAAIPLVPKPGDQQDTEMLPPVTQPLPSLPSAGTDANSATAGAIAGNNLADTGSSKPAESTPPTVISLPPVKQPSSQTVSEPVQKLQPEATPPKIKNLQQSEPVEMPKTNEQTPPSGSVPTGRAWVVQLGALKNASRVNEIIAQLRLSGYRAYTIPATPIQGQITRIYVGPDVNRAKMQSAVSELKTISGLGGVVKPYSVR
ncbi:DedD protein [Izhakiella capsodis]|uniref:Cell division protein DedD n=1 Tax=Izhakiella capsodis TaxID=1367852 RepID=A0A1I4XXS7_9GAMM|nr:cell division protein DedD [Izhakiella capsodis]SFN30711.1 DedD protein [Izhakiella capsodis]